MEDKNEKEDYNEDEAVSMDDDNGLEDVIEDEKEVEVIL
jgi:hypothetical protein